MRPLEEKIAARIAREGAIPFSVFMEMALYDPEYGYYRGQPFGRAGDFYTASQLQPVFGRFVQHLGESLLPGFTHFVDIGAGQEDLRAEFRDSNYLAVQYGQEIPKTQNSILFANEFFDALPVEVESNGEALRVDWQKGNFCWVPHPPCPPMRERRPRVREELARIHAATESPAYFVVIDYGYTGKEWTKFESGTLLGYRHHRIVENVLANPGEQDITAHVDWDDFFQQAAAAGWRRRSFSRMDQTLLACEEQTLEELRDLHTLQFKQLLFELGPRFDVAILAR